MNEATQPTNDAIDLHQMWFDLAMQGHRLLQKQADAVFTATREIATAQREAQREAQSAFTRIWKQARQG